MAHPVIDLFAEETDIAPDQVYEPRFEDTGKHVVLRTTKERQLTHDHSFSGLNETPWDLVTIAPREHYIEFWFERDTEIPFAYDGRELLEEEGIVLSGDDVEYKESMGEWLISHRHTFTETQVQALVESDDFTLMGIERVDAVDEDPKIQMYVRDDR